MKAYVQLCVNNEEQEVSYEKLNKFAKALEFKEHEVMQLQDDIKMFQEREIKVHKKKEEIYKSNLDVLENENKQLLIQLKELTEDLKALKKRYDMEKEKNVSLKKEIDLMNDELKIILHWDK